MDEMGQNGEPTVDEMFAETDSTAEAAPVDAGTPTEQAPQADEPQYSYTANGAERTEPLSVILQRASQGYNYSQQMETLKAQQSAIEERERNAQEIETRWSDVNSYAQENPDWWNHVNQSYQTAQTGVQPADNDQLASAIQPIRAEIDEIKNVVNDVKGFVGQARQAQEDQTYAQEVKSVQEAYPYIDLSQTNEAGESVEHQVLRHARENGIGSFRAAFRDYKHDQIVAHASTAADEARQAAVQQQRRQGIIGVTPTSQKADGPVDHRRYTDAQLMEMAVNDLENM